eukprot:SAG22_NODE_3506_length_1674_cov_1.149206_2_plen_67_part_01
MYWEPTDVWRFVCHGRFVSIVIETGRPLLLALRQKDPFPLYFDTCSWMGGVCTSVSIDTWYVHCNRF